MVAVIRVKRGTVNAWLVRVIVGEFGERKEVYSVILLVVAINTEVLLESLVHTLCLTIRLWVKGGR